MKATFIAITSTDLCDEQGNPLSPEDLMVYCARVSSPQNQLNIETAAKLLRYCLQKGHWSVFEQVDLTVEIETSRAIAAQILRHRSFVFQELSQRYARADLGFETHEARLQDPKNRQSSLETEDQKLAKWWEMAQWLIQAQCFDWYNAAIERGIAKELARMVLPLSTKTRLYMKGPVRSWIHYLKQRLAPTAQKEHREVAQEIEKIFKEHFPCTYEAMQTLP